MQAVTGDIESIQQGLTAIVAACNEADTGAVQTDAETDLPVLGQTLDSLLDVMQRVQGDAGNTSIEDVTEIGEYAIRLIENLAANVDQPGADRGRLHRIDRQAAG